MENGLKTGEAPSLAESKAYFMNRIDSFDTTYMRQLNPHIYKVSISDKLKDLKLGLLKKYLKKK
jgi:nicotinate phosphoribosyltransferase